MPQICTQGLSEGVVVISGGEDEKKIHHIYIKQSGLFIYIIVQHVGSNNLLKVKRKF